jgi:hypothetical protein
LNVWSLFGQTAVFNLAFFTIHMYFLIIILFSKYEKYIRTSGGGGTGKKQNRKGVLKAEPYITGGFKGMRALLVLFDLSLLSSSTVFLASFLLFLISKLPNTKIGNF